ncbi:MAG: hypothetical protein ACRCTR_02310 [Actinomycetota bacterium]
MLAVLAVLVGGLVLYFTGDEPGGGPVVPSVVVTSSGGSVSASPSPSWTPADQYDVALLPDEARTRSPRGAEEFVRFVIDRATNKAMQEANPDFIEVWSLPGCKTCAQYMNVAAGLRDRGERYKQPAGKTLFVNYEAFEEPLTLIQARVKVPTIQVVKAATGEVVETYPPADYIPAQYELKWTDGHWMVAEIRDVEIDRSGIKK